MKLAPQRVIEFSGLLAYLLLVVPAAAGDPAPALDLSRRFLLLQSTDRDEIARQLDEAAAAGYRIVCVSTAPGKQRVLWYRGGIAMLLERPREEGPARSYRLVSLPSLTAPATRWSETLDDPGSKGFRFVAESALVQYSAVLQPRLDASRLLAVLEKPPDSRPLEYRIRSAVTVKALYKGIEEEEGVGFRIVRMVAMPGLVMLVLEREAGTAPAIPAARRPARYRYVDAVRDSKLEELVKAASAEGYRVRDVARYALRGGASSVLLEKTASAEAPYSYLFASGQDRAAFETALNEAGKKGYQLHPRGLPVGFALLERAPSSGRLYGYRVLAPGSAAALEEEVAATVDLGYSVVGMTGGAMVVLEKAGSGAAR